MSGARWRIAVGACALATLASATTAYAAPSPDLPAQRIPEEVTV